MLRKYLFAIFLIFFTYAFLLSKDTNTINSYTEYVKGRNYFSVNLSPSIYTITVDLLGYEMFSTRVLDKYVRPILASTLRNGIESMIRSQINILTSVLTEAQISGVINDVYNIANNTSINVSRKTYGFGISFIYDFIPLSFMTVLLI